MEKKIPNDNLEKFLQRALGNLEENPSAGLWDKIAADLPPAAAPLTMASRMVLAQKWAAGIAAALLIGFSTFQYLHHRAEITRLSEELSCTQLELRDLQERTVAHIRQQETAPNENTAIQLAEPPVKVVYVPHPGTIFPALQYTGAGIFRSEMTPESEAPLEQTLELVSAFEPVPISPAELTGTKPDLSTEMAPPIEVFRKKSRSKWSAGVQAGAGQTTFRHTPGTIPFSGGGEHQEQVRSVNVETVQYSRNVNAGFTVNYGLGKNFALVTGLQYRRFESQVAHNPELKFGDREEHEGGPGQYNGYKFNYFLNVPSGTMLVTLSAEKANPNEMISSHEKLEVTLTTDEKIEFVSVPLVLGYQVGQGRFSGQLRAGLMANIGMGYQTELRNLSYGNQKFQPLGKGAQITPPELHPVSFDYYLGAGLAVDFTPAWRLVLMPSFSGGLTQKIDGLFKDSKDFSLGANAEINYRF